MIYLLDVAKIVTIPLIPKALGLPRAICYSGLHFGPCKIRYSEKKLIDEYKYLLHGADKDTMVFHITNLFRRLLHVIRDFILGPAKFVTRKYKWACRPLEG
jgi:hypothetical protein